MASLLCVFLHVVPGVHLCKMIASTTSIYVGVFHDDVQQSFCDDRSMQAPVVGYVYTHGIQSKLVPGD